MPGLSSQGEVWGASIGLEEDGGIYRKEDELSV